MWARRWSGRLQRCEPSVLKKKVLPAATLKSESYVPLSSTLTRSRLLCRRMYRMYRMYCSNHDCSFVHPETKIVIMSYIPFPHMQQVVRPVRARS
ncbi:hypothetical protein F5Y06DRAFT_264704 [Hypoxylon sp. FL0890]|nr:hypothetical protein F5Y06DRAFT_264704 [Hypoxylon sp. FL0890]